MKIKFTPTNHAFTRIQWLLIICLSVLAFELGIRFSQKNLADKMADKKTAEAAKTNAVTTNFWVMREEAEPIPIELDTNVPPETITVRPVSNPPQTNAYVQPGAVTPEEQADPGILKGDGPTTLRKVPQITNSYPRYITNTHPARANNPYGIRIALP